MGRLGLRLKRWIKLGLKVMVGIGVALMIGGMPWMGVAQTSDVPVDPTEGLEPTPGPRMEDFNEFEVDQFARVVALVFLYQEENPGLDAEGFRQQTIRTCGLSPDQYDRMNYVFTGDPDFLYVVTRQISQIPEEQLNC